MRHILLATTCIAGVTAATPSLAQAAYPCDLMVLDGVDDLAAVHKVYSFASAQGVSDFFGTVERVGAFNTIASQWFPNGYNGTCGALSNLHMKVVRFPVLPARAHLFGGNLNPTYTTLTGTGAVNVTSQGYGPWTSGNVTLSYSSSLTEYDNLINNAAALQAAINNGNTGGADTGLPTGATFTISSFSQKTCTFKGYVNKANLNVTDWTNGGDPSGCGSSGIPLGSQICDVGATFTYDGKEMSCGGAISSGQENLVNATAYANNATTHNPAQTANVGTYAMFLYQQPPQMTAPISIRAYWMQLDVSSVQSGRIAVGQQIQLTGSASFANNECVIWKNLAGNGTSGASTWQVACVQPTNGFRQNHGTHPFTTPCDMEVKAKNPSGSTHGYLEISSNNYCPYGSTSIGYLTDNDSVKVGSQLKLTKNYIGWTSTSPYASFADTSGRVILSATSNDVGGAMNYVQTLDSIWGYFVTSFIPYNASDPTIRPNNYQGGPAMPYGVDPDLNAWVGNASRSYFEGCGGMIPPGVPTGSCPVQQ
jgi:hypothetical protein